MYTWKIWDGKDVGNISAQAIETDTNSEKPVALFFKGDKLTYIQTEKARVRQDLPFEEDIQMQCDELNATLLVITEQTEEQQEEQTTKQSEEE